MTAVDVWYRALATVEHNGARLEARALVSSEHPAVAAQPESFERVHVAADGSITPVAGEPIYLSRPRPAVLMSDGSIEAMAPAVPTPAGPAEGESVEPMLPGGLTWPKIEATYHRLAAESTGWRKRRRLAAEPSRPELAVALDVSAATLKRACKAAGKGTRWPPAGF